MTVADDFSVFNDACKIPTGQIGTIGARYQRITRQLNRDFWTTDSETAHSLYTGSYGRDTAARGISDLDMGFNLPTNLYDQYRKHIGNGPSQLLQAVRRSMQKPYPSSDVAGDGQVVVIQFDDGVRFEVLPYFPHADGSSWIYPNANAGGDWKICNPRAEIAAVHTRNLAVNKNLKRVCRMARVWRDYCSVPMSGMLIDTLAYQFIERYEHRDKSFTYYDYLFRDFFAYIAGQSQTQSVWRAPGSASHVYRTGVFEHKARSAELRAREAVADDQAGREWSRRQRWRQVFGPTYPG